MSNEMNKIQGVSTSADYTQQTKNTDFTVISDIVDLPSQGIFYPHKKGSVTVEYLTASDENILTTQGLIRTGTQFDVLLSRKIMDRDFTVDSLLKGDKTAILLHLRKTGYGSDYQVKVTDPNTGETFDAVVDLELLKPKPITVMPDEDGLFEYTLPVSKKVITFRILTDKEETTLLKSIESKTKINGGIQAGVTERLKAQIVAVDGNTERMYIHRLVDVLPVRDSLSLRVYMAEVEPDLDLTYEFTNPSTGDTFQADVPFDIRLFYPNARV
jgi:hypothetical protein